MNLLAPFGYLYGRVVDLRNYLYDRGILKSYDLGATTISVGNITTGGTGKTPLVAYIARLLADNGAKVCVLTRGYGRKNESVRVLVSDGESVLVDTDTGGDEPIELARKLLGKAIVVADANRVAAAKWAKAEFGITAFVLDDGFQHRRARRHIDFLCIDATDPFGNRRLLPAGTLRESLNGLSRANALVITRGDQAEKIEGLIEQLASINDDIPQFRAETSITGFVEIKEFHGNAQSPQSAPPGDVFAFAGIANNKNFFRSLEMIGIQALGKCGFSDHHPYSKEDIDEIEARARSAGARCLVTTAKDAVKLEKLQFSFDCFVAKIETVIDDPDRFRDLVLSA